MYKTYSEQKVARIYISDPNKSTETCFFLSI